MSNVLKSELKAIAKRRGMVRWIKSGAYERVEIRDKQIVAYGPASPIHALIGDYFLCVEIDPKKPVPVGEVLYPRGPMPYSLLQKSNKEFRVREKARNEARYQKWCNKVVLQIMES